MTAKFNFLKVLYLAAAAITGVGTFTAPANADKWLLGPYGGVSFLKDNQANINSLLQSADPTVSIGMTRRSHVTLGADLLISAISPYFALGFRYDDIRQSGESALASSSLRSQLFQVTDTIYLRPYGYGFNPFVKLGAGWVEHAGGFSAGGSNLSWRGKFIAAQASLGLEIVLWRLAILGEGGYRYARIPKNNVTAANGSAFESFQAGNVIYINSGGSSQKLITDVSGWFYGVQLRILL